MWKISPAVLAFAIFRICVATEQEPVVRAFTFAPYRPDVQILMTNSNVTTTVHSQNTGDFASPGEHEPAAFSGNLSRRKRMTDPLPGKAFENESKAGHDLNRDYSSHQNETEMFETYMNIFNATGDNAAVDKPRPRFRRLIPFPSSSLITARFDLFIPIQTFTSVATSVTITVPFVFDLPTAATLGLNTLSGRSYGGGAQTRRDFYDIMENALQKFGFDGRACVLRAICEIGDAPLLHDGLLGEIMTMVLRASYNFDASDEELVNKLRFRQYLDAEKFGRMSGGHCHLAYPTCPISITNLMH